MTRVFLLALVSAFAVIGASAFIYVLFGKRVEF